MTNQFDEIERVFLAFGDKTRLRLLDLLRGQEVSVNYLCETLSIDQPKVSRHLAYLRSAGMVETRREGKWIYYRLTQHQNEQCNEIIRDILSILFAPKSPRTSSSVSQSEPPTARSEVLGEEEIPIIFDNSDITQRDDELEIYLL